MHGQRRWHLLDNFLPLSAVFLSIPKIATEQDNLTGNLTDRVLVKLSESHSLPECHGMMDVGSLDTQKDTHNPCEHTDIPRHTARHISPTQTHMGPSTANPLPLSQHLVLAVGTVWGWSQVVQIRQ